MRRKEQVRSRRHKRIRKKIFGTSERPRLVVHRSHKNLMAQLIDDLSHHTLLGISTLDREIRGRIKSGGNIEGAKVLGEYLAERAKKKGIIKVRFDRGGYKYHGRIKAFADSAREHGLEF